MPIFKKSSQDAEPSFGFSESLAVLIVILCILGYLIIFKQQEPQAPLFIAFILLAVYGKLRGFRWDTVMEGMRSGLRAGVDPLVIFLSTWRWNFWPGEKICFTRAAKYGIIRYAG